MALKRKGSFGRGFAKVTLLIITIFLLSAAVLHIWLVSNAKRLLIELVARKSDGKFKLELSQVSFDIFSSEVKIHEASLGSTNKIKTAITYQISFRKVTIHTNSLWSLATTRTVEINKIKLFDPVIEVFNWQKDTSTISNNNLSLGKELGKLYNSIQDGISALNTHSISILNAKLVLVNKTDDTKKPLVFSNIFFTLKHINKHGSLGERPLDHKNIIFSSSNQDISFTDGIHRLSFKRLMIEQSRNSIILDSCTIVASPTQNFNNGYTILFKRLALIGVDFDTLYKTNLIKADSVYCEYPLANFNLNAASSAKKTAAKGIPDVEKVIKEFSGNLNLGFVGVRNADIHVTIIGKNGRSNINSGKGNFQVKNLRINPDSSELVSIKSFDMLIKGYLLYNADSSCIYSFDSVRFANNKLLLNNFSVHTAPGINNKIRNYRDYSMPYFELLGVDWTELIFKQNLKATEAVLHYPTINLKRLNKVDTGKKSIIFNSRQSLDDFMDIERLKIINGKINIKWGELNYLQLDGLNLRVLGDNLMNYRHVKLRKDIEALFFSGGYLKVGNIMAQLKNVTFRTNDEIHVEQLLLNNHQRGNDSRLNDVSIKNIYTDETNKDFVVDGLEWKQGNITINSVANSKIGGRNPPILIKNISGKETQFKYSANGLETRAFIEEIQVLSLSKKSNTLLKLNEFKLKGRDMDFLNQSLQINASRFSLSDNTQEFSGIKIEQAKQSGTLLITAPLVQLSDNINSFPDKDFHFTNVFLQSPVINFKKQSTSAAATVKIPQANQVKIDHIQIYEPDIRVHIDQNSSAKDFRLPYAKGNLIKGDTVLIAADEVKIGILGVLAKKAEITNGAKVLKIDDGVDVNLSKINISLTGDKPQWEAMVNSLAIKNSSDFVFKINDDTVTLKDFSIGNCQLSSSSLSDMYKLIGANHDAKIHTSGIKYYTNNSLWQCFNLNYNGAEHLMFLDSLNYHPYLSRDSVIAGNRYQTDYINFTCGNAKLYGFDISSYIDEKKIAIQKASFNRPSISAYRDKFPPYQSGVTRKLFVEELKDIRVPLSINQVEIDDANVSYTEMNGKSRLEGNLLLTHINGNLRNIKNYDFRPTDSLSLDFTGRLLDTALFRLGVKESYVDPLYGFTMNLTVEPGSLIFLNPLLAPLSNIKFTSGILDTFDMRAIGNNNIAYGRMKFYYHGLRLHLLKNGGMSKSTLMTSVASVFVNAFVLRTNNNSRTGLIYFERLKDRSFFNYMNKIIFSGLSTSVGASKNRQFRKKLIRNADPVTRKEARKLIE
ncbi:MAG: hypothetical protein ABI416_11570 [Ginsengibacter sp.]